MAGKRALTHQRDPSIARLKDEAQANIDDLERKVAKLEARVAKLERLADYVRGAQYDAVLVAYPLIPAAPPARPPT